MEPMELALPTRRRAGALIQYLTVIAVAELLLIFANLTREVLFAFAGLFLDLGLVLALPPVASRMVSRDPKMASFLGALTLGPIVRIISLTTPLVPFSMIQWLAIVSVAMILSAVAVMRAQRLRPRDVFLGLGDRRFHPLNVAMAIVGFLLGSWEFQILRPAPWVVAPDTEALILAVVVVFVATGFAEELVFRGIILQTGVRLLGRRMAVLYVTFVFTVLHIGFLSFAELLFVFLTGILFAVVVLLSKSLWGAAVAHAAANIAVYLIRPFGTS